MAPSLGSSVLEAETRSHRGQSTCPPTPPHAYPPQGLQALKTILHHASPLPECTGRASFVRPKEGLAPGLRSQPPVGVRSQPRSYLLFFIHPGMSGQTPQSWAHKR